MVIDSILNVSGALRCDMCNKLFITYDDIYDKELHLCKECYQDRYRVIKYWYDRGYDAWKNPKE